MALRQRTGSVLCTSCGVLVGVGDATCYNCGRRNPGLWGFAPILRNFGRDLGFVPFIMGTCILAFVASLLLSRGLASGNPLNLLSPDSRALLALGASGAIPVFGMGRWWTVLSASWLHGGLLHIFFNLMWVRQLAPATAELYGPGRSVIIYTLAGIAGFALSSFAGAYLPDLFILRGGQFTVGASAPIFGLLGALVYYGRRTGSQAVHGQAVSWALGMGLFGLFMPGIDNYAHAGGFLGGFLMGRILDPLKPERIDHLALGTLCLAASVGAILYSAWTILG